MSLTGFVAAIIIRALVASGPAGLGALFALMAVESFGIPPLPSEVILPVAGIILAGGSAGSTIEGVSIPGDPWFTWPTVMVAAVGGGLTGAIIGYEIGRVLGLPFVHRIGRRFGLEEKDLQRAQAFFDRRGPITVLVARLVPLVRAYISYPAGAAKMNRPKFAVYTAIGATPFTYVLVYLGVVLGTHLRALQLFFQALDILVGVGLVAFLVYAVLRLRKRRQRTEQETKGTSASPEG